MIFRAIRYVLYPTLFVFSTILLGLTAYRIHYTKSLSNGDILTTKSHFYDPRIVALLVVSILILIFSLVMLGMMAGNIDILIAENIIIWGLWIFLLVTAAVVNREWSNLKWCRGSHKVCRILETIKAFAWILWGFLTIVLVTALIKLALRGSGNRRTNRGTRGGTAAAATYPDTRQTTTTGATVHDQPRAQAATTQGVPATHGMPTTHGAPITQQAPATHGVQATHEGATKQNTYAGQPQPSAYINQPQSPTTAGALYENETVPTNKTIYTDRPVHTDPRQIV